MPSSPIQQNSNNNASANRGRQRKPLKVVVVGSASVGKTSILRQFVYHTFDPRSTQTTIGCDFWHRNLSVATNSPASPTTTTGKNTNMNNNTLESVSLQVWDTAGMDTGFQSLAPSFFRGADGALLVYDLTNPQSFEHARTWRDMFVSHAGSQSPILLVGNKLDLESERKVTAEQGEQFVRESREKQMQRSFAEGSRSSSTSRFETSSNASSTSGYTSNNNNGIMMCGCVELTASNAEAVEKAFIQLTQAMLEVEKTRAASEVVSQNDLKRVRLGSLPPSNENGNRNGGNGNDGKKCSC
jgi:small GTP-binding protein